MGVIGLTHFFNTTFIDNVVTDMKLMNCKLLIDGYSLMYKVNSQSYSHNIYGGNYNDIYNNFDKLFTSFKKCNIEPIFLLDGAREDKKFQTTLRRSSQRVYEVSQLSDLKASSSGSAGNKSKKNNKDLIDVSQNYHLISSILPIMTYKIFITLLEKHRFTHIQCFYEADYDLACLSNLLGCPILSRDSDFYIYDLKYGYISIDWFEMEAINDEESLENYMQCKIYKLDNLIEYYNSNEIDSRSDESCLSLKKEMLPIFAVLCGNDYVDNKDLFKSLLSTFDGTNNNLKLKRLRRIPAHCYEKRKKTYYHRLLSWLTQFSSKTDCTETILKFTKAEKHETIRRIIYESVNDYMCIKTSFASYYLDLIRGQTEEERLIEASKAVQVKSLSGTDLSYEFLTNFRDCKLTRLCLDVLKNRRAIFTCQVELSDWPSTYLSSINIRRYFYFFLLKKYELLTDGNDYEVKEYLRHQKQIKTYEIKMPKENLSNINVELLNHEEFLLQKVFLLDTETVQHVLKLCASINLTDKIKYFFIIINYWLNSSFGDNEEEKVIYSNVKKVKNKNYLRALIVSLIKSSILDPLHENLSKGHLNKDKHPVDLKNYDDSEAVSSGYIKKYLTNTQSGIESLPDDIPINDNNSEYLKGIISKFYSYNLSTGKSVNIKIVHCLSEFQSVILSFSYLQELAVAFGLPSKLELIDLNCYLNNTFLHNFIIELNHRTNPDLFIEECFGRKSFFKNLYYEFMGLFNEMFLTNQQQN